MNVRGDQTAGVESEIGEQGTTGPHEPAWPLGQLGAARLDETLKAPAPYQKRAEQ